jgi:hypothetical protein
MFVYYKFHAIRGVTSPFCLGGCLLELRCETDDALQQKKIFVNIFPKKVGDNNSWRLTISEILNISLPCLSL